MFFFALVFVMTVINLWLHIIKFMFDLRIHLVCKGCCTSSICLFYGIAGTCSLKIVGNNSYENLYCLISIVLSVTLILKKRIKNTFLGGW